MGYCVFGILGLNIYLSLNWLYIGFNKLNFTTRVSDPRVHKLCCEL